MTFQSVLASYSPSLYMRLGEASGTFADSSGNGHVGTAVGTVTYGATGLVPGDANKAISLATTGYISVPDAPSLRFGTSCFIVSLIQTTEGGSSNRQIVTKWSTSSNRNYFLGKIGTNLTFQVDGGTYSASVPISSVNDGLPHLVIGVADAATGQLRLYVDGIKVATNTSYTGVMQTGTAQLCIGTNGGDLNNQRWNGTIDEVAVGGTALSDSQVLALRAELGLFAGELTNTALGSDSTSWSLANTSGGTAPYSKQLQRSPTGAGTWTDIGSPTAGTTFSDSSIPENTYDYRVAVTDAAAATAYSNVVTVLVQPQEVTIGTLTYKEMENALAFRLTYTGTAIDPYLVSSGGTQCQVAFSADGGTTWQEWFNADLINEEKYFQGAIADLDANTSYILRLTLVHDYSIIGTNPVTQSFTTQATPSTWETLSALTPDRYVDTDHASASDLNAGTSPSAPWKTLRKALAAAPADAVVRVVGSATRSYTLSGQGFANAGVKLVAATAAADVDGQANAGTRVQIEYATSTVDNSDATLVSGPAGSTATYPQVTATPWVNGGTLTDDEGVTRIVWYWQTNTPISSLFYSSTRFGDGRNVAPCETNVVGRSGIPLTLAEWKSLMAENAFHHSSFYYETATGRLHVLMPLSSDDPNTYFVTLCTGTAIDADKDDVRVSGCVFRGFTQALFIEPTSDRVIFDRNDVKAGLYGLFVSGNKDNPSSCVYPQFPSVFSNRFYLDGLYSVTQAQTGTLDPGIISWSWVKNYSTNNANAFVVGRSGSGLEGAAFYQRGGAQGMTFRNNRIEGLFNGCIADNGGYDSFSSFGADIHHNAFIAIADDCIEPEQSASCWVVRQNTARFFSVFFSGAPMVRGPVYLIRNALTNQSGRGTGPWDDGTFEVASCLWKYGGDNAAVMSRIHWLHNTSITTALNANVIEANAGGVGSDMTLYNNIFRGVRNMYLYHYDTLVEDGNQFATTDSDGLQLAGVANYTSNVSGYRTAYTANAHGRTNPKTNTEGDFQNVAVIDAAFANAVSSNDVTPTQTTFVNKGAVIPHFSTPYPGSGAWRIWHYSSTAPDKGAVEDGAGVAADTTPPILSTKTVNTAGTQLDLVFTEASAPLLPTTPTGFTVVVDGSTRSGTWSRPSSLTYRFTFDAIVYSEQVVTVSYTPGNVTDSASPTNALEAFGSTAVTNTSTQFVSTRFADSARTAATGRAAR